MWLRWIFSVYSSNSGVCIFAVGFLWEHIFFDTQEGNWLLSTFSLRGDKLLVYFWNLCGVLYLTE